MNNRQAKSREEQPRIKIRLEDGSTIEAIRPDKEPALDTVILDKLLGRDIDQVETFGQFYNLMIELIRLEQKGKEELETIFKMVHESMLVLIDYHQRKYMGTLYIDANAGDYLYYIESDRSLVFVSEVVESLLLDGDFLERELQQPAKIDAESLQANTKYFEEILTSTEIIAKGEDGSHHEGSL